MIPHFDEGGVAGSCHDLSAIGPGSELICRIDDDRTDRRAQPSNQQEEDNQAQNSLQQREEQQPDENEIKPCVQRQKKSEVRRRSFVVD